MRIKQSTPICEHCGHDERTPNAPHQLPVGTVLQEQYVIGRALGQGGFGITYMGWDRVLNIPVAIKEYYPRSLVIRDCARSTAIFLYNDGDSERFSKSRERFIREATSLAKLGRSVDATNIVRVHNLIHANATAYIIMDYVDGIDLHRYMQLQGGTLTLEAALQLLLPLMDSLGAVHAHHIVHRDISPDNIMVLPDGTAKLIDFGAAHEVAPSPEENQKSTEAILKYGFAPLEQYLRKGALGSWTDVYALCATLYFCTTGLMPPNAPERALGDEDFEWEKIPNAAPHILQALQKGTALHIEDRIQTMAELHRALCEKPDVSAKETAVPPVESKKTSRKKPSKRVRKLPLLLLALAVILAGAALYIGRSGSREAAAQPAAPTQTAPGVSRASTPDAWKENVLMHTYDGLESEELSDYQAKPVFRSNILNTQVLSVTFLDSLAEEPADSWDVSAEQNGTVKAWAKSIDGAEERYHLYIGAEGGINGQLACRKMFLHFTRLNWIDFNGAFHTELATDMCHMFSQCQSLRALDVRDFCTSNVTDMGFMFDSCRNVQALEVSKFDTSKVTSMGAMFLNCEKLMALDVSNFDTSHVTDMAGIFNGCSSLTALDVTGFQTANTTNMNGMFAGCSSLAALDISSFDTTNVTDMSCMFHRCEKLTQLDIRHFDTGNVTNMNGMFYECSGLTELDLSTFDTARVKDMSLMFCSCRSLTQLDVSSFDTTNVTDMSGMFQSCVSLSSLDLSHFETGNTTSIMQMFQNCYNLTELDIRRFNVFHSVNYARLFNGCSNLVTVHASQYIRSLVPRSGNS